MESLTEQQATQERRREKKRLKRLIKKEREGKLDKSREHQPSKTQERYPIPQTTPTPISTSGKRKNEDDQEVNTKKRKKKKKRQAKNEAAPVSAPHNPQHSSPTITRNHSQSSPTTTCVDSHIHANVSGASTSEHAPIGQGNDMQQEMSTSSASKTDKMERKKRKHKPSKEKPRPLSVENGEASAERSPLQQKQNPQAGETSSPTKETKKGPKKNIDSLIDAALHTKTRQSNVGEDMPVRSSSHHGSRSEIAKSTKEGTILDASGLTHEEMLADRLYFANQLQWLGEHYGLQYKKGPFSKWEQEQIMAELMAFQKVGRCVCLLFV